MRADWQRFKTKEEWLHYAQPATPWLWIDDDIPHLSVLEVCQIYPERCIRVSASGADVLRELRQGLEELEKLRCGEELVKTLASR